MGFCPLNRLHRCCYGQYCLTEIKADRKRQKGWAALVRAIRWDLLGMTQEQFAEKLGLSQRIVCAMEKGNRKMYVDTLHELSKIFQKLYEEEAKMAFERGDFRYKHVPRQQKERVAIAKLPEKEPKYKGYDCPVCLKTGKVSGYGENEEPITGTCTFCKGTGIVLVRDDT
ncbi:MAG: helix-turn-helix transcriptional regulator [Alphaproteobacteria bacterium]|nr:helix-turn-helix transcriptional regulator [Alphaproteobacteria bacterium]MDD9919022.1 helix-turn-helix transcriptional regulator [Alphaproteobacteria bacterium]